MSGCGVGQTDDGTQIIQFSHARLSLSLIPMDVDGITKTLRHFDWLDAPDANLTSHLTTGLTVGEIRLEAETTS